MSDPATWVFDFRWHLADGGGYVEARFRDTELETPDHVSAWEERVRTEFARFGEHKVWLLIGLDGLRVRARAARAFGEARSRVLAEHVVHSFRYGGDRSTLTSIATSRVIHGAEDNVFANRDDALAALIATRAGAD